MDYLLSLISASVQDEAMVRLIFSLAIGASAVLVFAALGLVAAGLQDPVRRRLLAIRRSQGGAAMPTQASGGLQLLVAQLGQRFVASDEAAPSATRLRLIQAGYRSLSAPQLYWAWRLLLPLCLFGAAIMALPLLSGLSLLQVILLAAVLAGAGWLLPAMVVDKRRAARINRLRQAFPDALDLMVVCVESGLALPQAIERVAEELAVSHGELAEELALVNAEIRAGISSADALRNLAERTGLEDIGGLISLLAQSIRFGSSVADTLRIYAEEFRDRRTQAAEEQAAKIGTKLVFPLIFCLWPSFFLVAIGPAIIGVLKAFGRL
ncbi:type II secretion system F family protein [Pseudomonas oligotrophica]|uniref:type II secretion system F family protein n=1 Tax=Pseudomonas oligotrophica TaxID=2912055 RepID=UPI001F47E647|nr:type II secretion system F family protein [Pseudomonas oligotrophica]MCF7202884.1 type II secretion system F family protein [Pseudomonas oligotrophica]